jgi:hypothetical protein
MKNALAKTLILQIDIDGPFLPFIVTYVIFTGFLMRKFSVWGRMAHAEWTRALAY